MTAITEVDSEDSGVFCPATTPEEMPKDAATKDSSKESSPEEAGSNNEVKNIIQLKVASDPVPKSKEEEEEEEDDDDDDIDETLLERIYGLGEMFPESVKFIGSSTVNGSISFVKGAYSFTRSAVWVAVSSSLLLFAPVMFELERLKVEEMMKQDRNRLVLGPGTAISGGAPGMAPPPPAR